MKNKIKAWAFMADGKNGKCFIPNPENIIEIYLKKPPITKNPFTQIKSWKPTKIEIIYKP